MIKDKWLYLNTYAHDGVFNMELDNYIFDKVISGVIKNPVLRFYCWDRPTVSLGVNQDFSNVLELGKYISSFPFVKRITGGSAVFHGLPSCEITYSLSLFYEGSAKTLYYDLGNVFLSFLEKYGLKGSYGDSGSEYLSDFNCFSSKTSADIVVNDIKVIGSAQCRKKKYILQHGSIRLDEINKLSRGVISYDQAAKDLKTSFEDKLGVKFITTSFIDKDYEKIAV